MEGTMRDRERDLHVRCWIEGRHASPFKGYVLALCVMDLMVEWDRFEG